MTQIEPIEGRTYFNSQLSPRLLFHSRRHLKIARVPHFANDGKLYIAAYIMQVFVNPPSFFSAVPECTYIGKYCAFPFSVRVKPYFPYVPNHHISVTTNIDNRNQPQPNHKAIILDLKHLAYESIIYC